MNNYSSISWIRFLKLLNIFCSVLMHLHKGMINLSSGSKEYNHLLFIIPVCKTKRSAIKSTHSASNFWISDDATCKDLAMLINKMYSWPYYNCFQIQSSLNKYIREYSWNFDLKNPTLVMSQNLQRCRINKCSFQTFIQDSKEVWAIICFGLIDFYSFWPNLETSKRIYDRELFIIFYLSNTLMFVYFL